MRIVSERGENTASTYQNKHNSLQNRNTNQKMNNWIRRDLWRDVAFEEARTMSKKAPPMREKAQLPRRVPRLEWRRSMPSGRKPGP